MSDFEKPPKGEENHEEKEGSIEEAVMFIEMTKQECAMLGANDMEIPTLMQLAKDVKEGNVEPAEGKKRAAEIKGSKMDYR